MLMISEGMLHKNTLKSLTLDANFPISYFLKNEFQKDIISQRNVRFQRFNHLYKNKNVYLLYCVDNSFSIRDSQLSHLDKTRLIYP